MPTTLSTCEGVSVGARWFIPEKAFDKKDRQGVKQLEHGRGWLATVRAVGEGTVEYHCDGDDNSRLSVWEAVDFVKFGKFVEVGPPISLSSNDDVVLQDRPSQLQVELEAKSSRGELPRHNGSHVAAQKRAEGSQPT